MQKKYSFRVFTFLSLYSILIFFLALPLMGSVDCKTILNFLSQTLDINKVLSQKIIKNYGSNAIIERSIVTTPVGWYYLNSDSHYSHFSVNFIYLATPGGVVFGNNGTSVNSLFSPNTLAAWYTQKISSLIDNTPYSIVDFSYLAESFNFVSILKKELGFCLDGAYELPNNVLLYAQIPFIFKALHPSMPSEMQSVISMETAQFGFNPSKGTLPNSLEINNSSRDLLIQHSVYDTFGIQNPVIGILKKFCDEVIALELRCLLPGVDISQSNVGGSYSQTIERNINENLLKQLLESILNNTKDKEANYAELKETILCGIDRLIYGSYYTPFSYEPVSFSPSLFVNIPLPKTFSIAAYFSYVYSLEKFRKGAAVNDCYSGYLNSIDLNSLTDKHACPVLDSVLKKFTNKLIPILVDGYFSPGYQLQANIGLKSVVSDMSIFFGIDSWYKSPAQFLTNGLERQVCIEQLGSGMQINGFANFELIKNILGMPICIELAGQASFYSVGIGNQYGGKVQFSAQY